MQKLSDWIFGNLKAGFYWLKQKSGWQWETLKFALRMLILIGIPQILAVVADNSGVWWADSLSIVLPLVDKAWFESDVKGALVPF